MNPARSPGLWQSQASQEPPTLFPGVKEESFLLLEGRVCLGTGRGHLLLRDAPGADGPYLDQHSLLYSFANICSESTMCQGSLPLKGKQPRHSQM